jgi:GTP-binding protein Era
MNALVGEKMSIITPKPQTTRHRILGILSGEHFQLIFSDTPGFIDKPAYRMQNTMNHAVRGSFEDADVLVWVSEYAEPDNSLAVLHESIHQLQIPLVLVLNKIDLYTQEEILAWTSRKKEMFPDAHFFAVSALKRIQTEDLLTFIREKLPEGPEYYPQDQLTDRNERFFVAEIIREKILLQYKQEIPYSVEVRIESFKEDITTAGKPIVRIQATIFVSRKSQKPILIGKSGSSLKALGEASRLDIESFLASKVYLELFVKIRENWRDDERSLKQFGYEG